MLTLAACGGGGGGGGGNDPPAPPAQNVAPTVQAGADQTITMPATAQLQGSATDDGPAASLTYSWSIVTGTGVTFSAANAASTTATFPAAGTYVLRLTVSDGSLSSTDDVQVIVNPVAGGTNIAPVVNAGADATVVLPATTAQLQGTATDDNLPSPVLSYQWTTAAAGVTIDAPATLATAVTLPATAGTYEFTLTVSDGELSATDSIVITVAEASALIYPDPDTDQLPFSGWEKVEPAAANMNAAKLAEAEAYAISAPDANGDAGAGFIVRGGRLVHAWGNFEQRYDVKSATKSIGGAALALARMDGKLTLADTAVSHLPSFASDPAGQDPNWVNAATLLQLATHSAGFEKPNNSGMTVQPGTVWRYSDAGVTWLADALTNVYQQDLLQLMHERVWSKIGISGYRPGQNPGQDDITWRTPTHRGATLGTVARRELHSGITINANSMARVGLLFLRKGVWKDNARVLSEEVITEMTTPPPELASLTNPDEAQFPGATQHLGVLWWTNADGALSDVPRDAYWGWGLGDNLLVVIPSLDLVIVRTGNAGADAPGRAWGDGNWTAEYAVLEPFLRPIVCAADANSTACSP